MNAVSLYVIVFSPAILAAVLFVIALIRFARAKKQPELRRKRRGFLIAASVVLGVIAAAYAAVIILLAIALRNM